MIIQCQREPRSALLRFEIRDTGVGIAPEHLAQIFEAFHIVDNQRLYSEGAGIGLSLCQRLLRLMGQTLSVESVVNQGSVFRFELRLDVVETAYSGVSYWDEPSATPTLPRQDALIPPPASELEALYRFSMMGDVDGLQECVLDIKARFPECEAFADCVDKLAVDFRIEDIQRLLGLYITTE